MTIPKIFPLIKYRIIAPKKIIGYLIPYATTVRLRKKILIKGCKLQQSRIERSYYMLEKDILNYKFSSKQSSSIRIHRLSSSSDLLDGTKECISPLKIIGHD